MNLLSHLSRSVHQLQHGLHARWQEHPHHASDGPPSGAVVLSVALLSVAAAAMLVLAA